MLYLSCILSGLGKCNQNVLTNNIVNAIDIGRFLCRKLLHQWDVMLVTFLCKLLQQNIMAWWALNALSAKCSNNGWERFWQQNYSASMRVVSSSIVSCKCNVYLNWCKNICNAYFIFREYYYEMLHIGLSSPQMHYCHPKIKKMMDGRTASPSSLRM